MWTTFIPRSQLVTHSVLHHYSVVLLGQDDTANHISSELEVVIRQHDMREIFHSIVLISNMSLEKNPL